MKPYQVIFRKEFFEVFRDGRTLFNIIISPLLITPLLMFFITSFAMKQAKDSAKEKVAVAIVGLSKSPTVSSYLKDDTLIVEEMKRDEAERQIKERKIQAALLLPDDTETKLKNQETLTVTVLSDEGSQRSSEAANKLQSAIKKVGDNVISNRLHDSGLSRQFIVPFQVKEENIKGGASSSLILLATLIPYILGLSAIMGGIYVASDSIAGEKERGTLETLLISPAPRRDVVLGKFLAVICVSLLYGVLSLIGLIWPFYVPIKALSALTQSGLSLTPMAIFAMLLVQIPLAVFGAGLLLSVSTFARNQKEMQTYLAPLLLVVTVGAMISMFLKSNAPLFWAAVPITNAALVLKQALEGVANPAFIGIACVASVFYAGLAVWFATHSFQKESILLKA